MYATEGLQNVLDEDNVISFWNCNFMKRDLFPSIIQSSVQKGQNQYRTIGTGAACGARCTAQWMHPVNAPVLMHQSADIT